MQRRSVILVGAIALCGVSSASAQAGAIRLGPRLGYDTYAEKTGIKSGALVGLDATYFATNTFGFGAYVDFSRVNTDGTFFPIEIAFGEDSTGIFAGEQPLTVIRYGAQVVAQFSATSALEPYLLGGIGAYQIQLDPQVERDSKSLTELQFTLGGGIDFTVGSGAAIRLDVRDYVLTKFDRENLYPAAPRFRPVRFPDVLPAQEPFSGSTHNLVFALSFQFTPGGAR